MLAVRSPLLTGVGVFAALICLWVYFYSSPNPSHASTQPAAIKEAITGFFNFGPRVNTDLILYSYHETDEAKKNFLFFLAHALHSKADFILMLNGAHTLNLTHLTPLPNIQVIARENRCFDLGGFHEILSSDPSLRTRYKRFIFTNASLRGPFFPSFAKCTCWSSAYWDQLSARVKLVGMTWNCANSIPYPPHLQSMILAFDATTLNEILLPQMKCYETMHSAVADGETALAGLVMGAGYEVFATEGRFAAHAGADGRNTSAFLEWCVDAPGKEGSGGSNDILHTGNYGGASISPYETIFAKTNRDWDERDRRLIDLLTEHADLEGYSSYEACG